MAVKKIETVFCRTRFIGFHHWPDAPEKFGYLRDVHRHEFRVEVEVAVSHSNRDVEFINLRRELDEFIREHVIDDRDSDAIPLANDHDHSYTLSCEMIAGCIYRYLVVQLRYAVEYIEVSEDGENGARVYYVETE